MNVTALMPVKGFRNAKQRLSPLLGSAARELLAETMFRDILRQVRLARGLAATFVVTGDDRVAAIAASAGAEVMRERAENGEKNGDAPTPPGRRRGIPIHAQRGKIRARRSFDQPSPPRGRERTW